MASEMTATETANLKSLELLFDYTKFHIGFYLTLATTYIAVASLQRDGRFAFNIERRLMYSSIVLFMIAGVAGGVITSSITQCFGLEDASCSSARQFLDCHNLGPWSTKLWLARYWTYIEHTAFWLGLVFAVFSFDVKPKKIEVKSQNDRVRAMSTNSALEHTFNGKRQSGRPD